MATTIQDFYSTITKAGTQAILDAGTVGPKIEITGFRIGAKSAAEGAVADKNDTDVDDFVYQGDATKISYQVLPDSEACLFQIVLDETIGDFKVGQIGLMIGTTLFSKSVLYRSENKWKSVLPSRYGNTITFNLILNISDIESCINLTLLRSNLASLPQVESEVDLPDAAAAIYNTYVVRNHTKTGTMALASKRNDTWNFTVQRLLAGNGDGVIPVGVSAFDTSVKRNMAVYYDETVNKYFPATNADAAKLPMGVRTSDFEITTVGLIHRYAADDIWPATLSVGEYYSTGATTNAGKPVTDTTSAAYGLAVSNETMFIDFGYAMFIRHLNQSPSITGAIAIDKSHTHATATTSIAGFMSAADKTALNNAVALGLLSAV